MSSTARTIAVRLFELLRTITLVVAITIGMFLFVEIAYRAQRSIRARVGPRVAQAANAPRDPQAGSDWYAQYNYEEMVTRGQRWKSYVYWGRRPGFQGKFVNLDSAGHRLTTQPTAPAQPAATVFFFGGSTMWGVGQRDDHTIASEASRRLQTLAGPGRRIAVTNFGETGYIGTQELLELIFALRAGARPDVVVFYDGINDVGTTVQYGRAGIPQNEAKRVAEFQMGRKLDRQPSAELREDVSAVVMLVGEAAKRFAFVNALRSLRPPPTPTFIAADSAARSMTHVYVETARVVEGLATQYGFTPIYVWQPTIHSTRKVLTPFETRVMEQIRQSPFHARLAEVHRAVPPLLGLEMAKVAPGRFVSGDTLFSGDPLPVYIDLIGHTTETAIPRTVDAFWPMLRTAVEKRLSASPQPR
jgi:hypothetical protein